MKRIFLIILLIVLLAYPAFSAPIGGPPFPRTGLKTYTGAGKPDAAANPFMAIIITDANGKDDCAGGGTDMNICISNGTAWVDEDAAGSTGYITGAGDCSSGDCFDGTSDGGTWIRIWDGDTHYVEINPGDITSNLTFDLVAIDVDYFAGDTTDDNLIPASIIHTDIARTADVQPVDAFLTDISDLTDPSANRLLGWDDTDNDIRWIILGTGLSYDAGTDTLSATGTATLAGMSDTDISGLASGDILVYDGSDSWDNVVMSGDATIDSLGALTIEDDAIEESMLKAVDSSSDEDILTKEDTTGDFEWHSVDEIIANMSSGALPDGYVVENDLAAALAFDEGDFLDLSAITMTAATDEGISLPFWADVSPTSDKRFIAWDESGATLKVYKSGTGWYSFTTGTAPTDVGYLLVGAGSANLSAERSIVAGLGIDYTDGGANGNYTLYFDPLELDDTTWGNDTTGTWTFDGGGTNVTFAYGDAVATWSHMTVTNQLTANAGITIATGQDLTVGSTRWDNGSDKIDGEQIADGTIDDDALDWVDITLTDFVAAGTQYNVMASTDGSTWSSVDLDANYLPATTMYTGGSGHGGLIFGDSTPDVEGGIGYASNVVTVYDGTAARTIPFLETNPTITGNWVNTANPWADNEVANALTVTAQAGSTWNLSETITALSVYTGAVSLVDTGSGSTSSGAYIVKVYDNMTNVTHDNVQQALEDLDAAIQVAEATAYDEIENPGGNGEIAFGSYTGTYTSGTNLWDGMFITNTQGTITGDSELLTLQYTDGSTGTDGQLNFLLMIANSQTLFEFDESGLQIGTGTPTNALDGGDLYVTGDVEIDGTLTLGALSMAGSATPTWTWIDSDGLGSDDNAMRLHANFSTPTASAEDGDWRIDAKLNGGYIGTLTWLNSDTTLHMGVLKYDSQVDWTAEDETGYESLKIDFDTATENEIAISSVSGVTSINIGISEVSFGVTDSVMGTIRARGKGTGNDDGGYIGLDTPDDHDATISSYDIFAWEEDLYIKTGTEGETVLWYDGSTKKLGIKSQTPVIDDPDNFASNFTGVNFYGGTFIANADGTSALTAAVEGMNFSYKVEGDLSASNPVIDPNGTEAIYLNGTSCGAGVTIVGDGETGPTPTAVFQYRSAGAWSVDANGFSCGS